MAVTRRVFFSGAMAAPFLAQLGGTAQANPAVDVKFTLLSGLGEIRLTELALKRLATEQIQVQAVAPAAPILGADGKTVEGVTLTPEYATGTIDALGRPGTGSGRALGGVVLRNATARMEITGMRTSAPDGRIFAFLKVNDEWVGELPLYVSDPGAMRLSVEPGLPGKPTTLKGSGIPVTPSQEGIDAFAEAFGVALFTLTDKVFTASGSGLGLPLPVLSG
ncbi:hypothetical protein [Allokutzneria albata]|uniref:Uncharacterized protein n=1 Tax=Allokutzneria albata TaxID=211114 RepID=A0A1G9Y2L5_ALLAB|nr:hypothetical protein [Allokutzneria albata]SDN03319.1 hypothetical protein SAMN04489726_4560 [Allokutzneria albata]